jgi:hypothetical protein
MAIEIGDTVYVPRTAVDLDPNEISPFLQSVVRDRQNRSVQVDLPDGTLSDFIATSKVTKNFGVLIVRIGDFAEEALLDPLAKVVLNYLRMLLPDDSVRLVELRTTDEFATLWGKYHAMCEQIIIIGHGSTNGIYFGDSEILADDFVDLLEAPNPGAKELISLACKTGYSSFGQKVSRSAKVSHMIGPFHSVHGCVGSLFASTYLHERLLASRSPKVAFKHARNELVGATSFRLWTNGNLTAGPKT